MDLSHRLAPDQGLLALTVALSIHQDISHPALQLVLSDLDRGTSLRVLVDQQQVQDLANGKPRRIAAAIPAGRYKLAEAVIDYPFAYKRGGHLKAYSDTFTFNGEAPTFTLAPGATLRLGTLKLSARNKLYGNRVLDRSQVSFKAEQTRLSDPL